MDDTSGTETVVETEGPLSSRSWERPLHDNLVRELLSTYLEYDGEEGEAHYDEPLLAEALLRDAVRERATDIHIDPQIDSWLVRFRIDGSVLDAALLNHGHGQRLLNQFMTMARLSPVTHFTPEEGRITHELDGEKIDLRLAQVPCLRGVKMSIRIFVPRNQPVDLDELGLHEQALHEMREWLDDVSGLLLVCGPTGSGKTTTLYTLLHQLKLHERNVMTIEDPVEYEIDGINHIQVDSKHGLDFANGLKSMLRLDPDYMMVGEIRDADSADAAVNAAASGHAVMSTLHSRDAVGVLDTLRNHGLNGQEISTTLMLVVAQRLVRKLCPECSVEEAPDEEERRWLERLSRKAPEKVWHARGCEQCNDTGYSGRTGVFEVWRVNKDEYQLILDEADRRSIYRNLAQRGHAFLLDDGLRKVERGITSLEELRSMGGMSAIPPVDVVGEGT